MATDPRLGRDIKTIMDKEGGGKIGDYLIITKEKGKYSLGIIKPNQPEYTSLNNLLSKTERHLEIEGDMFTYHSCIQKNSNIVGYNKIFYGIPGCGKSYKVDKYLKDNNVKQENIYRTTFYLDYSNSDFIGQILPKTENGNVTYEYIAGPFTKALIKAMSTNEMVYLVIEEINRGNAPAIFGDIFQLLDRKKNTDQYGAKGQSEYPITNEFIESYLLKNLDGYVSEPIVIPSNLTILATMNSSDQNVFPLDTAFKRRWKMERVEGNIEECSFKDSYIPFTDITWREFREAVNAEITKSASDGTITEDKKLGPWFASEEMFVTELERDVLPVEEQKERLLMFLYNVIDYIYNDVCKFDKEDWFGNDKSFDDVCVDVKSYSEDNATKARVNRYLDIRFLAKD